MTDTKAPDQGLLLADDGQVHTRECVTEGWWRLDWDADCVHLGVPPGGDVKARAERALFATALMLLPVATGALRAFEAVCRGR